MPCLMRVIWLLRWLEDSVSFSYFSFNLTALNIAGIRRGTGPAFRLGLYSSNSFSNLFKTILNRLLNRPGQPLIAISDDDNLFVEIVLVSSFCSNYSRRVWPGTNSIKVSHDVARARDWIPSKSSRPVYIEIDPLKLCHLCEWHPGACCKDKLVGIKMLLQRFGANQRLFVRALQVHSSLSRH